MKRSTHAVLAALILGLAALPADAATPSGEPYTINAIVPQTGGGAFLGRAFQDTFRAIENVVNAGGGIQGHPLHIASWDSQSNPQVGVQVFNGLISHAPLVVDGDTASGCLAKAPIVAKSGPLLYCLSNLIVPVTGSYVFSSSIPATTMTGVSMRYFRERDWKRIAVISSTDATGSKLDQLTMASAALPENATVQIVDREYFNLTDISVTAQIARIKAANPQAILIWTTGTSLATVLRGLSEAGLDVPVSTPQSNLIYKQLDGYAAFLPKDLYFTTVLALTPESTARGPLRDAQATYARAFAAIGVRPDIANNLPWDPIMLLVDALRHLGPDATPDQLRDYLSHVHGWVGVNGVYDFASGDQRGIGESASCVVRWDNAKGTWVRVSLPRGFLAPATAH